MKNWLLVLALLCSLGLAACDTTLEMGVERTPARPTVTPTSAPAPSPTATPNPSVSGLVYVRDGTVYLWDGKEEHLIGPLPSEAGLLVLGPRYLACVSGGRIQTLSLVDGATRTLLDLGQRPGQDVHLRWSNDGSTLAYAVAWSEPDGSRVVELGITDGYQQTKVDALTARPAGPTPTLPPLPPVPPEPGFANLNVLGFDRSAGRLAVTQAGGQERYAAIWLYDTRTGKRTQTIPLNQRLALPPDQTGIQELVLSPDLERWAMALPGRLQIERAADLGAGAVQVELPAETHATWLSWSPDGRRLAYLLNEGASPDLVASPSIGLWVWEAETGQARQLTSSITPEAALLGWTSDGAAVLVRTLEGISRRNVLSLVEVKTGQIVPIPWPEGGQIIGWIGEWSWPPASTG